MIYAKTCCSTLHLKTYHSYTLYKKNKLEKLVQFIYCAIYETSNTILHDVYSNLPLSHKHGFYVKLWVNEGQCYSGAVLSNATHSCH